MPPYTESEARSEGFELEDYESEILDVWPDNECAMEFFRRVGTRWMYPPTGGSPYGLRWEALYPLMDRLGLSGPAWDDLQQDVMVMEQAAVNTFKEFAPKAKK